MDGDIAVIGLGSMGSMAAWRISERTRARVIGFERFGVGHARGAAAGESRLFRTAYHEGAGYVPLLLRSRRLWQELETLSGRQLLLPTGTLSLGDPTTEALSEVRDSVRRHDLPHQLFDADELRQRYPQHAVADSDCGILDELGGALRPEVAVASAVERARTNGLEVHEREPVLGIETDGPAVIVRTGAGRYRVRHAVVTLGPWAQDLFPVLASALTLKTIVLTWFLPRDVRRYRPEVFPTFIRDTSDFHIFGAPSLDGYSVKVSGSPMWGTVPDADSVPRWLEDEALRSLGEHVQRLLPELHPEPARHSVHTDAFTRDKTPAVGPVGENVTVLAGFSGHGFKLAPVFGEIAAQYAVDGGSDADVSMFAPERLGF
ncbi:N-methyl-L-tryptophan oxidase [Cryptosporangium sp. NPDC051539]|uniref:N-methyl-L-tryptophan oxidase n=1 Tax=Cryptosporangium sp. NPDC051539 TaxID=3363962 RepID=UPI00378E1B95